MVAIVHLNTEHNVGPIDRRVFGGFVEHLGRRVYQGIYDPGSPRSDASGFRVDVLDALRRLNMPIVRYPGGNYVSGHDWKNGVGPKEMRPKRPDAAWQSIESNQFGTDEFMAWCRQAGTRPMMAVNLGTAGASQAAELLEYCNLPGGTLWSDRRAQNGHPDPYNVKLWCLGNEADLPWQACFMPAHVYAQRAYQASFLMKGLDPTIETIAAGSSTKKTSTYMQWDREVLEYCWPTVDYISAHRYSGNKRNDTAWYLAEGTEIDCILQDYAGLLDYVRAVKKSSKRVYLAFDEWNVWYRVEADTFVHGNWTEAPALLEEQYNLEDALVCAQYLSAFVRRADLVKIACHAQLVNVLAPILTRNDGLLIQPTFYPFALFSQNAVGVSLRPVVQGPHYMAGERGEVPALDVSATYDQESGDVSVFVVNRDRNTEIDFEIRMADRDATHVAAVEVLGGTDVKATNTWDEPVLVVPQRGQASVREGSVVANLPGPSFSVIRFATLAK